MQSLAVKVTLLDLGWLYADGLNFLSFVNILNDINDKELYMTDFTKTLLDIFWDQHKSYIFKLVFIPYVLYLLCTIYYMIKVVCADETEIASWERIVGFVNLGLLALQIRVEYIQMRQE